MKDYGLLLTAFRENDFSGQAGTTYVVGDIHGQIDKLWDQIRATGFDPAQDRLLFCGDLINRGRDSLDCLDLLREPWFYPVMGNHDYRMLGTYIAHLTTVNTPEAYQQALTVMDEEERHFALKYGDWLNHLSASDWQRLHHVIPPLLEVPLSRYALTEDGYRIGVVHNDVWGDTFRGMATLDGSDIRVIDHLIYNRPFVADVIRSLPETLAKTKGRAMLHHDAECVSTEHGTCHIQDVDLVIHGHTVFRSPTLVGNRLYLETGGYQAEGLITLKPIVALLHEAGRR